MAKPPKKTRGLAQTEAELEGGGPIGSMHTRVLRSRLKRQQLVAADEPAVPGSLRPSEIRARAKKPRSYTNDAAHGETISFPPSEKTRRIKKISL